MGVTLSYSSTWDEEEFYPGNTKDLMDLLLQNKDTVQSVLVSWFFDWSVILTIYLTGDFGEKYDRICVRRFEHLPMCTPTNQPEGPNKLIGVEDVVEHQMLVEELKLCNPRHVVEWGYQATITFFESN